MTTEQIDKKCKEAIFGNAYGADWKKARNVDLWQSGDGSSSGLAIGTRPNWEWSIDFARWGAFVILSNGWVGFTFPATYCSGKAQ